MTDQGLYPSLEVIRQARKKISGYVTRTPVVRLQDDPAGLLPVKGGQVFLKLELLQVTGTFKPRGALNRMLALSDKELEKGVTAVSAGNHAIAVGFAARVLGTSAKVVMPRGSNPARVNICRSFGAEVVLVDGVHAAFDQVRAIEEKEGRTFVHPFEGPHVAAGTGSLGLELLEQVPDLEAVIVPIGGGGLCAGVSTAIKQLAPGCQVFGVEPTGADTMHRSFKSGRPEAIDKVSTIADSLGAPHAAPYSFSVCRRFVDELVRVDDDELCRAIYFLFSRAKLAVEPAGAAATAALLGPLKEKLEGKKVGLIICGTNIDSEGYAGLLKRGRSLAGEAK